RPLPAGFLPDEDQGQVFMQVTLPPGATQQATRAVLDQISRYLLEDEHEAVESVLAVVGFSFNGYGQNAGAGFVRLKDWDQRKAKGLKAPAVVARSMAALSRIKSATVIAFQPPPVLELGL